MSRGKRYDGEQKLNLKKVFAVFAVILAILLFIIGMNKIIKADKNKLENKNIPLHYFAVFTNGNWGVINSSGEIIIQPANGEMVQIPNKEKPIFICTYEVNYVDGTYKTKAINEKNEEIFTEYDNVYAIENFDENEMWYENNLLKVQKNGKYGLINLDGAEVLPCEYDSITVIKGIKNSLVIKKDGLVGLVNSEGKMIVPVQYAEISAISADYKDGYIVKNAESKYGVVNSEGKTVLEAKYEKINNIRDNDKYVVKIDGKLKVISEDGTAYLENKVANVSDMNNGDVIAINKGKYGVISIGEEQKIPYEYEELKFLFDDKYIAKKDGKYGVITNKNEVIVDFKYTNIIYNTEYLKAEKENGIFDYLTKNMNVKFTAGNEEILENNNIRVKINDDYKYYNSNLEEKSNKDIYTSNTLYLFKENGKYGYKNKDGKTVVEAKYEDGTEQNDYGFVSVKKDGKWGSLDQHGKLVSDTKYNLDKNQKIDFIGKWHIGVDKKANFYTDAE